MEKLLEVKDLHVSFSTYAGDVKAVRGVSFDLYKGECIGIVGESGCGKSVTANTIMRLLPKNASIKEGPVVFDGKEITKLKERQMQSIRGSEMGMIFQDPMTSLNPTMTIGRQIAEGLVKHQKMSGSKAKKRAVEMLKLVGIPNPESRVDQYPHQFSGGMRQRAMIAISLAADPGLLIADEPTTALDVTIQAQILQLMRELQDKLHTSIILITHDLGVVAQMCKRVIVMYAGKVVETGTVEEIFYNPQHPYTKGLLKSVPRLNQKKDEPLVPIFGTPPDLIQPPAGCGFCARCEYAMEVCDHVQPDQMRLSNTQSVSCWLQHPLAKAYGKVAR
jgi:oligopeptide transport system ATP-binding protein